MSQAHMKGDAFLLYGCLRATKAVASRCRSGCMQHNAAYEG